MKNNLSTQQSLPLPPEPADTRTFINASLWMVDHDGHRVIFVRHEPIHRIALGDDLHLRVVAVNLRMRNGMRKGEAPHSCGKLAKIEGLLFAPIEIVGET